MIDLAPHADKFDSHRRAQLRRAAAWSFVQKIEWLEEVTSFAARLRPAKPNPQAAPHQELPPNDAP